MGQRFPSGLFSFFLILFIWAVLGLFSGRREQWSLYSGVHKPVFTGASLLAELRLQGT